MPHPHEDWARPSHICTGRGLTPAHICTRTGLARGRGEALNYARTGIRAALPLALPKLMAAPPTDATMAFCVVAATHWKFPPQPQPREIPLSAALCGTHASVSALRKGCASRQVGWRVRRKQVQTSTCVGRCEGMCVRMQERANAAPDWCAQRRSFAVESEGIRIVERYRRHGLPLASLCVCWRRRQCAGRPDRPGVLLANQRRRARARARVFVCVCVGFTV